MQTATKEYPISLSENEVFVTEAARKVLAGLIDDADEDFDAIRIYVEGGGCSGMSYSMTFAEDIVQTDSILDCGSFKLLVDPVAFGFLEGCEIDYVTEGLNSTFIFKNAFQSVGGSGACAGCGGGGF